MAVKLAQAFPATGIRFWLTLQLNYDFSQAHRGDDVSYWSVDPANVSFDLSVAEFFYTRNVALVVRLWRVNPLLGGWLREEMPFSV